MIAPIGAAPLNRIVVVALKGNDGGFFEEPFNGNNGHIPLSRI
jgi:hypothetical protein